MGGPVSLVIPAAGQGRRMNSATRKPFVTLAGRPILHLALECFRGVEGIGQVIIPINAEDWARREEMLAEGARLGVTDIVLGGDTRTQSVRNALAVLSGEARIVLIHDAVRPFASRETIKGVIEAAGATGAAIAAVPVKDTIKRVENGLVVGTVPRDALYLAQTPQGFRREVLEEVYASAGAGEFTDDAGLVEAAGGQVAVVLGSYDNFKITTGEDLELARALMEARSSRAAAFSRQKT